MSLPVFYTKQFPPSIIRVGPLHEHRDLIPTVAKNLFNEWEILYKQENIHSVNELEQNLNKRCDNYPNLPLTFVAIINNNELAGTISIDKEDLPLPSSPYHSKSPWLASVFVLESYRNLGVAAALISSCEFAARARFSCLWLWTVKSVELYQKFGWKIIEEIYFPVKQKNITIMRKDFNSEEKQSEENEES